MASLFGRGREVDSASNRLDRDIRRLFQWIRLGATTGHRIRPCPVSAASLIQLVDALDEPEYYCIDVPGAADAVMLEAALQAHTCKLQGQEDELFTTAHPEAGPLYVPAYDLCIEADATESGSQLHLQACSDSPLQVFKYAEDRSFRLAEETQALCVAVEAAPGQPTGGPSHLRLDLILLSCEETPANLRQWLLPGLEPRRPTRHPVDHGTPVR